MSDPKPADRSYKRSWKNLLINRSYQLRFTLFMVGLAAVLMVGLGVWVMRVANETTEVSAGSVRGKACPKLPPDETATGDAPDPAAARPDAAKDAARPEAAKDAAKPEDADDEPHVKVQIDESSMTLPPALVEQMRAHHREQIAAHRACEAHQVSQLDRLERERMLILWAMIGTGILLVLGIAFYGIKMTHKVAGPLFKVGLYFNKMRAGRFDKVYNLRKGDQLVEFYDHFKLAHDGVVAMQEDDIAKISAVIAAAEAAGLAAHPAVGELRELLARKEKSIE